MLLDADTQDWLDTLAAKGPAQPPATLGEAWRASWAESGLHTIGGLRAPQAQALDELRSAYQTAAGEDVRDAARRQGVPLEAAKPDQEAAYIESLTRGLPDEAQKRVAPLLDINGRASAIAAKTERDAGDVANRAFGFSSNATMFLAGLARNMVDPETIIVSAAVAAATPAGVGLPAFLAREAAVNAGATALLHPAVSAGRETLGLAPTSFVGDVIESAVGGAALGGLFRAGGWAARRAFRGAGAAPDVGAPIAEGVDGAKQETTPAGFSERFDAPPAARAAAAALEPEDFDLAARHVDNRAVEDATALRGDAIGVAEHGRAIDDAVAALDRGEGASLATSVDKEFYPSDVTPPPSTFGVASSTELARLRQADIGAWIEAVDRRAAYGELGNIDNFISQTTPEGRVSLPGLMRSADDEAAGRLFIFGNKRVTAQELAAENARMTARRAELTGRLSKREFYTPEERTARVAEIQAKRLPEDPARPLSDYPLREVAPEPVKQVEKGQSAVGSRQSDNIRSPTADLATAEAKALRADAERAIAEAGDFDFHITDDDGTARVVKASELLREADDDAVAARELELCMTASPTGETQ